MKLYFTNFLTHFRVLLLTTGLLVSGVQTQVAAQGPCKGLDPGGNPAQSGLYAEYYRGYFDDDKNYFTTHSPLVKRVDYDLHFISEDGFGELGDAAIGGSRANPDEFSLRERGSLRIPANGTYTFYLTADDATYLWFDEAALRDVPLVSEATISNGGVHYVIERKVSVYLTKGWHPILVHYGEQYEYNVLVLEYENPAAGIERQVVPNREYCTSIWPGAKVANDLTLSGFPSPNTGKFTVRAAQTQGCGGQLQLLDIHGRICYTKTLASFTAEEVSVKITGMPTGMYMLYLRTTDGKVARQKIIIQGGK